MSWDRSRAIPWSKIDQTPGVDPDYHKEQVFREMRLEAQLQEEESLQPQKVVTDGNEIVEIEPVVRFAWMDMAKQAAFGGCIGACVLSV